MKKILCKIAVLTALFVLAFSLGTAYAKEATVSMGGGGSFEKGETFQVSLSYGGDTFGAATAKITYDSSILEYKSCSGAESYGGDGTVTVTMSNGSGTGNLSCKLKFTAKKSGSCFVTASTSDVYNIDMEELSAAAKSVKVTVKNSEAQASGNNDLYSLLISSGKLTPAFTSNVTSYSVNVDNDVTVCAISAKAADVKATFEVTGSKQLNVGKNIRKVIVTAENGKTKTYTITIYRADKDGEVPKPDVDDGNKEDANKPTEIEKIKVNVDGKEYVLVDDLTDMELPDGFSMVPVSYKGTEFSGIENSEKDVILALLETEEGNRDWFFFGKKDQKFYRTKRFTTAQIIGYEKDRLLSSGNDKDENGAQLGEKTPVGSNQTNGAGVRGIFENMDSTQFLILCMGATVSVLLLILIILGIRRKKTK